MYRRYINSKLLRRFFGKIAKNKESGCWEYTGAKVDGYGQIILFSNGKKKNVRAHRLSWEIHYSDIPEGLVVCHKCDNRKCVNPEHLFLGTQADNSADMVAKGRQAKGSKNNKAKVTEEDVKKIISLRDSGFTCKQVGEMFNLSKSQVSKIHNRQFWN